MKISELIKQLEEVKEFVGDKQVYLERRYNEPFKDCCMDLSS